MNKIQKNQSLVRVAVGLLVGWLGAVGTSAHADELIKVAGSTTVLPIVSDAAGKFTRTHPHLKITVNAGGSGVGIRGAATGRLNVGLASRELTEAEIRKYRAVGLHVHAVGRDAVACVVSSEVYDAGVRTLSREQIRDIYLGRIRNWKALGGPDRPIVVVDKERHRGTRHVFMRYVFGDPKARAPGARLITGSNNEEQAKIAQSDSAIGMLSFAWMNRDVVGVNLVENGREIRPTLDNVRSGKFPIARNLNLITPGAPDAAVREFVDYLLGPQGQSLVRKHGYISLNDLPEAPNIRRVAHEPIRSKVVSR